MESQEKNPRADGSTGRLRGSSRAALVQWLWAASREGASHLDSDSLRQIKCCPAVHVHDHSQGLLGPRRLAYRPSLDFSYIGLLVLEREEVIELVRNSTCITAFIVRISTKHTTCAPLCAGTSRARLTVSHL